MFNFKLVMALAVSGFVVLACSGSTSSISADEACADIAATACEKYDSCAPITIRVSYGDINTCKTRAQPDCKAGLAAPGTSATPDRIAACSSELKNVSCNDFFAGNAPASCLPTKGSVANGGACGDDSQCASAFCGKDGDKQCGSCAVPPALGSACVNNRCPTGLDCAANVCIKRGASGDSCDPEKQPCQGTLNCFKGKCVAAGKAGDTCDATLKDAPSCDLFQGVICVAKKCELAKVVNAGEPCGFTGGTLVLCSGNLYCKRDANKADGICAAKAKDGAGCNTDPTKGPDCETPAKCIDGVCQLAAPEKCK
ncbi:MAG: hypothetical protein JWM74_495 [Myxococcaceae bacterium]|nr:hypothetical protein [Myxococcaceae bacterium]